MEFTVECQKRPADSKPNALRREGLLPAVIYGHNVPESVALVVDAKTTETLLRKAPRNAPIQVNIPELSWSGKAMIQEVQKHPWKGSIYHVSFFAVEA
ncbi:MAG: 50S ribosomal protein L25 [Oculatellaceae cyanobacterium Prado106]|jgi:large subunit ribosomal protein L25|nr:50S ribosomal protein L25 [Oculatellaceae cyanobacterium Prado106]